MALKHIKNFLTGIFTFAKQEGVFQGENPMWEVEVPKGNKNAVAKTHAYTLADMASMMEALKGIEPARTVIATAAFTGLHKAELRGLRWGDLSNGQLSINRTVWGTSCKKGRQRPRVPRLQCLYYRCSRRF